MTVKVKSSLSFLSVWVISKTRWDCSTDKTIIIWSRLTAAADIRTYLSLAQHHYCEVGLSWWQAVKEVRFIVNWLKKPRSGINKDIITTLENRKELKQSPFLDDLWTLDMGISVSFWTITQTLSSQQKLALFEIQVWNLKLFNISKLFMCHFCLLCEDSWKKIGNPLLQTWTSLPTTTIIWRHFLILLTNTFWR